jgi:hypothetical protein
VNERMGVLCDIAVGETNVSERGRNECRWKEKIVKGRKRDRENENMWNCIGL